MCQKLITYEKFVYEHISDKHITFSLSSDSEDVESSLSLPESLSDSVDKVFFLSTFLLFIKVEFLLLAGIELLILLGLGFEIILLLIRSGLTFACFLMSLSLSEEAEADPPFSDFSLSSLFSSLPDSDSDPASEPELALLASSLLPASEAELTEAAAMTKKKLLTKLKSKMSLHQNENKYRKTI